MSRFPSSPSAPQASLSKFAESDVLLLCRLYYMNKEYNRALHVMEARGLCSSPDADHVVFRALTAQCLVRVCVYLM